MELKTILSEKKKTSAWLANQVGLSKVAVSNILTGKSDPSVDTLVKIAKVLNVSVDELLGLNKADSAETTLICPKCGTKLIITTEK